MDSRYERYNERLFEAYCKVAVDNAILKERTRKAARYKWEIPFSALAEAILLSFEEKDFEHECEKVYQTFDVQGKIVPIFNEQLAQAISYLLPKDREIILRYYFLEMTDDQVAQATGMTLPTISRRRKIAKQKIQMFLEGMK